MRRGLNVLALMGLGLSGSAALAAPYPFEVVQQREGSETVIYVKNDGPAPLTAKLQLNGAVNVTSNTQWPMEVMVPPRTTSAVSRVFGVKPGVTPFFLIQSSFVLGDPAVEPDAHYAYRLPFKPGTVLDVVSGRPGQNPSHGSDFLRHGYDFGVPVGKIVVAARDGVVIYANDDNPNGVPETVGTTWVMESRANSIMVQHADGSMGYYAHLYPGSALVKPGDTVKAGQRIALTGEAAAADRPFLHFAVLRSDGKRLVSVPIRFGDPFRNAPIDLSHGSERVELGTELSGTQVALMDGGRLKVVARTDAPRSRDTDRPSAEPARPQRPEHTQPGEQQTSEITSESSDSSFEKMVLMLVVLGLIGAGIRKVAGGSSEASKANAPRNDRSEPGAKGPIERDQKPSALDLALLQEIEWRRFEEVVAEYFRRTGYSAALNTFGPDGGIDVTVVPNAQRDAPELVQCKAWTNMVGVSIVRELKGVMAQRSVQKGYVFAVGGFSSDAHREANACGIKLVSGRQLIDSIRTLPAEDRVALLAVATEGDYTTPTCARCGVKMTLKTGFRNYWNCNTPRCNSRIYAPSEKS